MEETDSYVVLQISFADMNQRYAMVQKYKVNYRKTNIKLFVHYQVYDYSAINRG